MEEQAMNMSSMSILKLSAYVMFGEVAVTLLSTGIYMDARIRSIANEVLQPDQVLKSLGKLAEANPDQLPDRVCSEKILRITPMLNCGNLGCEKRKECESKVSALAHLAGIATGLASGAALSAYLFKSCLSKPGATIGFCVEDFNTNLTFGKLGFALGATTICGYYLSRFLVFSRLSGMSRDLVPAVRVNLMKADYEALGKGLKDIIGRTVDPQEIATIHRLAQKLLDNMPAIQHAICKSASLEREEAMTVVVPLESACRHVLAYTGSQPSSQPEKIDPPKEATPPSQPEKVDPPVVETPPSQLLSVDLPTGGTPPLKRQSSKPGSYPFQFSPPKLKHSSFRIWS